MVKKRYKDVDKWRKIIRGQKRRYYGKSQKYSKGRRRWTYEEDVCVLKHAMPDIELAQSIQRSVAAIQKRRHILCRTYENDNT